jgi:hypothetical protein
MPRYFFHLKDGNSVLHDHMGEEFANSEAARQHALQVAFELGRNRSADKIKVPRWLLITDAADQVLFHTAITAFTDHQFKPT